MTKIKEFIISLWKLLRLPEMLILPGNLAFFLILSLAPIITLFGVIASSLSLSTDAIQNFVGSSLPSSVVEILNSFLNSGFNTGNIILIIVGFFVASNGPDSIITASNILYKNERKNYIYRRVKALFMTFWLILLFIFILIFMAFGSFILKYILDFGIIGEFISNHYSIITVIKLVIAFCVIFMTIKIIYTLAPNTRIKSKFVNRGALFATISIMVLTTIYSFYVTNIAHYDIIYGSLSNIAILMMLIYFISYIIVLGIAINRNYYELDN